MVGLWLEGSKGMWAGCVEGKGLSGCLHIWEPLVHSCLLSACLWMDLYGTDWGGQNRREGREGLGGWLAPAEIQTGAGDGSGPAGGKGLGKHSSALPSFPLRRFDLTCATFLGRRAKPERDKQTPHPFLGSANDATVDKIHCGPWTSCS